MNEPLRVTRFRARRAGWQYVMLPEPLFEQLRQGILRRQAEHALRMQDRD
ncbi:MAG TPA: hypothetical protein VGG99_05690 [Acetobacteraceae bacterium]|jgi:hypothetical protein